MPTYPIQETETTSGTPCTVTTILRGGLGNQLFAIAQLIAFAKKHNLQYCVPLKVENPHYEGQKPYMFPGVNYSDKEYPFAIYKEKEFTYNHIPFMTNVCFDGYWQSWRYFNFCKEEVFDAFGFKYYEYKGVCAIHVRRGDYLDKPNFHPFVGEDYLINAVDRMNRETGIRSFKVFSDDPDWCEGFFKSGRFKFEIVRGNDEITDLEQGSWCEHQILSNGTFSLWQHFLNRNPNKICIAPKIWFGKDAAHNTIDLYPNKNCIKL
tara:strand:+ start:4518 stop:5309 length:792 start_codon:yes stop_codon:yes gene_type:complete